MIRAACTPISIALLCVAVAVSCTRSWAANPGIASDDDDSDEAAPLIVTADFNHDGIADLARVTSPEGDSSGMRSLTVSLGLPGGAFKEEESSLKLGRDPQAIIVGDFNGDGNPDLIVGDADGSLMEFLGDGKGNLVPAGGIAHFSSVVSIAIGDFNHDGVLDLAVSDSRANTVTILIGEGKGAFRQGWSFRLPMQGRAYHLAAADFNGDGFPDLIVADDDDSFQVMLGNGNGTFTYEPTLSQLKDPNAHCIT